MKFDYLKNTPWMIEYDNQSKNVDIETQSPQFVQVNNGYILPTKQNSNLSWGLGGVLDEKRQFIKESGISTAFGGYYDFADICEYLDDDVIFIGIIPKHIGHFLIDTLCRLWPFLDAKYKNYKFVFCSYEDDANPLEDKYGEAFELLGIERSQMIHAKQIIQCKRIIIPEPTMSFAGKCNTAFKSIIARMINSANKIGLERHWEKYDKIYFNKRFYFPANVKQVGEKQIEAIFEQNGYVVIAPEKQTLSQMIFLVNHCTIMASLSGTTSHYSMFSGDLFQLVSLNRLPEPLKPQLRLDALFGINNVYIDCYNKEMLKPGNEYGTGVIWVEVTSELKKFLSDNNMKCKTGSEYFSVIANRLEYKLKRILYKTIPVVKMVKRKFWR